MLRIDREWSECIWVDSTPKVWGVEEWNPLTHSTPKSCRESKTQPINLFNLICASSLSLIVRIDTKSINLFPSTKLLQYLDFNYLLNFKICSSDLSCLRDLVTSRSMERRYRAKIVYWFCTREKFAYGTE